MTNEQVKADIAANLPDNTSGLITPAKLRTEMGNMVDYSDTSAAAAVAGHDASAGAHAELFAAIGAPLIYYVDSAAGSDAASGISPAAAKQTIAAVTLAAGVTLRAKCGSHFREQINTAALANVVIESYGAGPLPVFDASDIITAEWTKTSGRTNVYEVVVTHGLTEAKSKHHIWEAGTRLVRVASVAACDSTAGTFYAAAPTGTTGTIYIHPFGSTNPISDGKVYEYAARNHGIRVGDFSTVRRCHTTRNGHSDGSLVGIGAVEVLFEECLSSDGSTHNVSIGAGVCRRCTAFDCEPQSDYGSATLFIGYMNDPTGKSLVFDGCNVRMSRYGSWALGFLAHGISTTYATIVFRNCSCQWVAEAFTGAASVLLVTGGRSDGCARLFDGGASEGGESWLAGHYFTNADESWGVPGSQTIRGYSPKLTIRNCEIVTRTGADSMIWPRTAGCVLTVENNTLQYPANAAGYPTGVIHADTGNVTLRRNVIGGGSHAFMLAAPVTLLEDNNIYTSAMSYTWNGVEYGTLAAYQAASGQGAASQHVDPLSSCIGASPVTWGKASPVLATGGQVGASLDRVDPITAAKLVSLGVL